MEKLILIFESEKTGMRIKDMIESAGLAECQLCHSAAEAKRLVNSRSGTAVVCGYKFGDSSAGELFEDLPSNCCGLVIAQQSFLDLLSGSRIFKLPAPVTRGDLLASVRMFLQMVSRPENGLRIQRSEEEREVIEAAKAHLMLREGMTESQAHRYLQKKSMDTGCKLSKTAQMVLDGTIAG